MNGRENDGTGEMHDGYGGHTPTLYSTLLTPPALDDIANGVQHPLLRLIGNPDSIVPKPCLDDSHALDTFSSICGLDETETAMSAN